MKNLDFLKNNLIAHRGVHYNYIENTLSAFRISMLKGYTIELDIHLTKDNKIVVFHDDNIKRITGVNKEIKDSTYDELKEIMDIPTLEEVINLVQGTVPIIIEFKFDQRGNKLEKEACKLLDNYEGEFAIQSFSPLSLLWFKFNRKEYVRGYLINSVTKDNFFIKYFLSNRLLNQILKPDYIGVNLKYLKNNRIVKLRNKYLIIGYTINSKQDFDEYCNYADNLICNIGKEPYK